MLWPSTTAQWPQALGQGAAGSGGAGLQRSNGPEGLNPVQQAVDTVLTTDHNATTSPNGISISEVCAVPCCSLKSQRLCLYASEQKSSLALDSINHVLVPVDAAVQIVSLLGGQYSHSDVRGAVTYLADQGHAFTTCDEEHFKSTAV